MSRICELHVRDRTEVTLFPPQIPLPSTSISPEYPRFYLDSTIRIQAILAPEKALGSIHKITDEKQRVVASLQHE